MANLTLNKYQKEYVLDNTKTFQAWTMQSGKTIAVLSKVKHHYPNSPLIIITAKSIKLASLSKELDLQWTKDGKMVYGDEFKLKEIDDKKLQNGDNIIITHHVSAIQKLIVSEAINIKDYILIIDEAHNLKNPGKVDRYGNVIDGKAGFSVRILAQMCKKTYFLSATPAPNGYKDYRNYLMILGEVTSSKEFEEEFCIMQLIKRGKAHVPTIVDYKNTDSLMQKVHKHFSIKSRSDPDIVQILGNEPYISTEVFKNAKNYSKLGNYHLNPFGEKSIIGDNAFIYKRKQSYESHNPDNDKIKWIKEFLEHTPKVAIYYTHEDDLHCLQLALSSHYNHIYCLCGTELSKYGYKPYSANVLPLEQVIILVQYQSGCEGISLGYHIDNLIHYSLPYSYYQYTQTNGRIESNERHVEKQIHILISNYEMKVLVALINKQDFDITKEG